MDSIREFKIEVSDENFLKCEPLIRDSLYGDKFHRTINLIKRFGLCESYRVEGSSSSIIEGMAPAPIVTFLMSLAQGHLTNEMLTSLGEQMDRCTMNVLGMEG